MTGSFSTYKPTSKILQKYINYYYFHEESDPSQKKKIVYYPTTNVGLTIYKNSEVFFHPTYSKSVPNKSVDYFFCFTSAYNHSGIAEIHPPFRKIGVLFPPFGINQFISPHLTEITKNLPICQIDCFTDSMTPTLDEVFNEESDLKKVELLDSYFERILVINNNHLIENVLNFIHNLDQESNVKVQDIAETLNANRRSLYRIFQKHMNCSVKEFIKVSQFRKLFNHYAKSEHKPSLMELSHQYGYYDQADFNKHFKSLTDYSPKKVFTEIKPMADNHIFWKND